MSPLWVMLLACSVWRGSGWSSIRDNCRQRCFPSTPADLVRHNQWNLAACFDHDEPTDEILGKPSWLSVNGSHRLAFRHVPGSRETTTAVLFCNGFRSDTSGTKVAALEGHCSKRGWQFCAFDYRGHGLSSGSFQDCTLSDWIRDASSVLENVLLSDGPKNKKVVLIGSSMGAWISIHLALRYNTVDSRNGNHISIAGILGIASAPDFLQDMYSSSTAKQQAEWRSSGTAHLPSRYGDPYPISWNLIRDAAEHWEILPSTKPISLEESKLAAPLLSVGCPVRLLHGKCDEDISWTKSKELADLLKGTAGNRRDSNDTISSEDILLTLVEDGDHRLSRPQDIEQILETLDEIVSSL